MNTNIVLPNNTMSIYYYDNKVIFPNVNTSYYQTFGSNLTLTIPANIIIYLNFTAQTQNNNTYYPFLVYSIPNIIINDSNNFAYNNNSGNMTLTFITYTNLTIYIEYAIPYFITLNFVNIKNVYINYSIYNGYIYNNQTIFLNINYITMPFPQYIYYRFYFIPSDNNYTIVPEFISGYLTDNVSYTIIGILNPSVNTSSINNTIPAPYQFNWIIPNFTIYGYTSDYLFALTFIAFLIGVAIYTGYKLKSDIIPILIIVIGLFLLYIVNLLPLWVSILTTAGIFVFYYFLRRGEAL